MVQLRRPTCGGLKLNRNNVRIHSNSIAKFARSSIITKSKSATSPLLFSLDDACDGTRRINILHRHYQGPSIHIPMIYAPGNTYPSIICSFAILIALSRYVFLSNISKLTRVNLPVSLHFLYSPTALIGLSSAFVII